MVRTWWGVGSRRAYPTCGLQFRRGFTLTSSAALRRARAAAGHPSYPVTEPLARCFPCALCRRAPTREDGISQGRPALRLWLGSPGAGRHPRQTGLPGEEQCWEGTEGGLGAWEEAGRLRTEPLLAQGHCEKDEPQMASLHVTGGSTPFVIGKCTLKPPRCPPHPRAAQIPD